MDVLTIDNWMSIFAFLDYTHLLTLTRVCKTFQNFVNCKHIWKPYGIKYKAVGDTDWEKHAESTVIRAVKNAIRIEETLVARYILDPHMAQKLKAGLIGLIKRRDRTASDRVHMKFTKTGFSCDFMVGKKTQMTYILDKGATQYLDGKVPMMVVSEECIREMFDIPTGSTVVLNIASNRLFVDVSQKYG